jgi:transcription elongation factor Elf1
MVSSEMKTGFSQFNCNISFWWQIVKYELKMVLTQCHNCHLNYLHKVFKVFEPVCVSSDTSVLFLYFDLENLT